MATHLPMSLPHFSNSSCTDADMDAWLDFSANNSPHPSVPPMAKPQQPVAASSSMTSPQNTMLSLDQQDDLQTPAKPSHEYSRFKQQTGLPSNSVPGLQTGSYNNLFPNSGTGLDEMSLMSGSGLDNWTGDLNGIEMDMSNITSNNIPSYFYSQESSLSPSADEFVDSSDVATQDSMPQNQRYFPGIHQQQRAAMAAKVHAQAQQQRRQQQMMQNARQVSVEQQNRNQPARRMTPSEAHAEETIARVVNQIRQNSQVSNDGSSNSMLPHIIRAKKDEEDMDEDERLLASEEGKKLSSKERRQLRNKVSARAFRSRRKEYIGQLEGEVAAKSEECNDLKMQNRALMEENARSRALIEKLLRHPAFTPFLEDISRDEALKPQQVVEPTSTPRQTSTTASPFGSNQIPYIDTPVEETFHVGMTMIPETPVDISSLNLNNNSNNNNWNMPFSYQQPRVFAVTSVPEGPSDPVDVAALSGKNSESLLPQITPVQEQAKPDYPVIERRDVAEQSEKSTTEEKATIEVDATFDSNPEFSLYSNISSPVKPIAKTPASPIESAKSTYFELVVVSKDNCQESLERMCEVADASFQRIVGMTTQL